MKKDIYDECLERLEKAKGAGYYYKPKKPKKRKTPRAIQIGELGPSGKGVINGIRIKVPKVKDAKGYAIFQGPGTPFRQ